MQLQNIVSVLALTSAVLAMPEEKRQITGPAGAPTVASDLAGSLSIFSVLQTGVPSELLQLGLTNPAAASSYVSSAFATGAPSWYSALPDDIKTIIAGAPAVTDATITGSAATASRTDLTNSTSVALAQSSILSSIAAQNASAIASANSNITMSSSSASESMSSASGSMSSGSMTTTTSGGVPSAATGAAGASGGASSTTASGGASLPTGVLGAGLAGAVGLVGLLAL